MNAKSFLLPTLLAVTATFTTNAQVAIKAGINYASISESATEPTYDDIERVSVVGAQAGLAFDLNLSEVFTIQPEILYIQKGGKSTYKLDDNNKIVDRIYLNYIEVPVLAKLKFYGDEGSGFYFVAGPFAGLALSGRQERETTLLGVTTESDRTFTFDNDDPDERERRLDWGMSFGGGVKFNAFLIDLRYNLGINNILDADADNENDNSPYRRTRGIGLTLGYEF